jgi:hypothetical protein
MTLRKRHGRATAPATVREIRRRFAAGATVGELITAFPTIGKSTVSRICQKTRFTQILIDPRWRRTDGVHVRNRFGQVLTFARPEMVERFLKGYRRRMRFQMEHGELEDDFVASLYVPNDCLSENNTRSL